MLTINSLCCFRLHTAGILIGWVGAVFSILNVVLDIVAIARIDDIVKYMHDQDPNNDTPDASMKTVVLTGLCIYLTLGVVNLVSSVLLVAGTMKERHLMLLPWLINNGFVLIVSILNFVIFLWFIIANGVTFGSVIGFLITAGCVLGFQYLIWTAIYSLYRKIRLSREQEQLLPNNPQGAYPSYTKI